MQVKVLISQLDRIRNSVYRAYRVRIGHFTCVINGRDKIKTYRDNK